MRCCNKAWCVRSVRREAQWSHGSRPQGAALVQRPQTLIASLQAPRDAVGLEQLLPTMTMPCLLYVGEADSYYPGALECVKLPKRPLCLVSWSDAPQTSPTSHLVVPQVMQFLQQVAQQEHAARR